MNTTEIKSINDVLETLDQIIIQSEKNNDPLGYFAALYHQVTMEVREKIEAGYFDDGPRMEKLDVIFARKYIDAFFAWNNNKPVSLSWEKAFLFSEYNWPLVLQHMLMGMNAHINLDLGIAAAEVSRGKNIDDLRDDFYRINNILSSMVSDIQKNLSFIWPPLQKILQKTGKLDNMLVDFSMEIARDGAWEFARYISLFAGKELAHQIQIRDKTVEAKTKLITHPKGWAKFLIWFIRLGEIGTVHKKIEKLKNQVEIYVH